MKLFFLVYSDLAHGIQIIYWLPSITLQVPVERAGQLVFLIKEIQKIKLHVIKVAVIIFMHENALAHLIDSVYWGINPFLKITTLSFLPRPS